LSSGGELEHFWRRIFHPDRPCHGPSWKSSQNSSFLSGWRRKGQKHSGPESPVDVAPPCGFGWPRISG
jgi:hypothetical protein